MGYWQRLEREVEYTACHAEKLRALRRTRVPRGIRRINASARRFAVRAHIHISKKQVWCACAHCGSRIEVVADLTHSLSSFIRPSFLPPSPLFSSFLFPLSTCDGGQLRKYLVCLAKVPYCCRLLQLCAQEKGITQAFLHFLVALRVICCVRERCVSLTKLDCNVVGNCFYAELIKGPS